MVELLVVVGIIGILTAVVLANLSSSRTKSQDTGVKVNLNNIRPQSLLFYDLNNGTFGTPATLCTTAGSLFIDTNIASKINAAVAQGNGAAACRSTAQSWAISVPLRGSTNHLCVDSANVSKQIVSALGAGQYSCP